jgi:hypothetical protein
MPSPVLIPPYVAEDKARKKPFTPEMEVSALLCLAEAQRKKPGILDASSEKISFLSKLHYPIWVVPWKGSSLLVDGLKIFSHSFPYVKLPNVEIFTEEIRSSVVNKAQFRDVLKRHSQTFEKPELTQISLEAVFAKEELLSVLTECLEQVPLRKVGPTEQVALVPPKLNEKDASKMAENAVNLWRQIQSEIKGLQYAINVLDEETSFEEEMILKEIEHIRELYETKIAPLRPVVEKKIDNLLLKRDAKIARIDKALERKLAAKLRQKRRHERELERLERGLIEYKKRRKMSRRRGDEISASKWEHRIQAYQAKLSETRRKLQSVSELIERIQRQGELEVQKVKADYQLLIENERKKLLDLEAARQLEIESRKRQIEEMKMEASLIADHIRRLIELKRSEASRIKEVTIPYKVKETTLLCLPFYLVRYETREKARYLAFPPVVAMDFKGIVIKLQKALRRFSLQSRIRLLLHPKSKTLEEMLRKTLLEKICKDNLLEKAVYELGVSNNILSNAAFKENLANGLEELLNEGWIIREEKSDLLETYA